jgi:serine/threonine protein kinase
VKLCDFGLSRTSSLSRTRTALLPAGPGGAGGSQLWLAPELWIAISNGEPLRKTTASDVYAFGLVMYEILTGCQPFHEGAVDHLHLQVPAGLRPRFEDWKETATEIGRRLVDLMNRCWHDEMGKRPNIREVYEELQQLLRCV